jgi:Cu-Zn family superoxide dismutase
MHRLRMALALAATTVVSTPTWAQTEQPQPATPAQAQDSAAQSAEAAPTASAAMKDAEGKDVGKITLTQTKAGVLIKAELTGLPAGPHGFHFHETGACEPPFESAGGHYNPNNAKHGFMADEGPHVGDIPNLEVGESGSVTVELLSPFVSLDRQSGNTVFDDDGTSLVVHADADDYKTDPSGNSGARIACGVIE